MHGLLRRFRIWTPRDGQSIRRHSPMRLFRGFRTPRLGSHMWFEPADKGATRRGKTRSGLRRGVRLQMR